MDDIFENVLQSDGAMFAQSIQSSIQLTKSLKYEKKQRKVMLGSCMYASWHVDSRVIDVAVTASNRQVMKWC